MSGTFLTDPTFLPAQCLGASEVSKWSSLLCTIDPWRKLGFTPDQFERYLGSTEPNLYRYVARSEREIEALICLRYPWLRGVYIELLAVRPSAQGQGLGEKALAFVDSQFARKTANCWVCVSEFNSRAQAFYQRHGFIQVAELEGLIRDDEDELLLRKRY